MKLKTKVVSTVLLAAMLFSGCSIQTKQDSAKVENLTGKFDIEYPSEEYESEYVLSEEEGTYEVFDITYFGLNEPVSLLHSGSHWLGVSVYFSTSKTTDIDVYLFESNGDFSWDSQDALYKYSAKIEEDDVIRSFALNVENCEDGKLYDIVFTDGETVIAHSLFYYEEFDTDTVGYIPVDNPVSLLKPVIYLYPEEEMNVSVDLNFAGEITCTYPEINDGWNVLASPDGTLYNLEDGRYYDYLFWEGEMNVDFPMNNAVCVPGSETATFLEDYLTAAGLNDSEIDDFISFWLPRMQNNPYNLIAFQQEAYTDIAELNISPKPDNVLRIYMTFEALDEPVESEITMPEPFVRDGFTVVEWGGSELVK